MILTGTMLMISRRVVMNLAWRGDVGDGTWRRKSELKPVFFFFDLSLELPLLKSMEEVGEWLGSEKSK